MGKKTHSGFEAFLRESNEGWSFVAVKAPMERVAAALQSRPDVLEYKRGAAPRVLEGYPEMRPVKDRRFSFLVQVNGCDWTILLRTILWIDSPDFDAVSTLAADLSEQLETAAIASAASDDGASCTLFMRGGAQDKSDTNGGVKPFCKFIDQQQLRVPLCFISSDGNDAVLHLKGIAPDQLVRTDRIVFKV